MEMRPILSPQEFLLSLHDSRADADPEGVLAEDAPLYFTPDSIFAKLHAAMVPVPRVRPGDSVWWHPDMIHRLTKECEDYVLCTYESGSLALFSCGEADRYCRDKLCSFCHSYQKESKHAKQTW